MEMEIDLPHELPAMTLPDVVFFPQALLPLHIFEPRYRAMLRDVLAGDRLFAVAALDARRALEPGRFEPPHRVATVGIVRACQKSENGTSNLLMQGLCRVRLLEILGEEPYRRVRVQALLSTAGAGDAENRRLRDSLARLIAIKRRFGAIASDEMAEFLKKVDDPEVFVDLAAFSLCESGALKQKLLETLDTHERLRLFSARMLADIEAIKLRKKLQGGLGDDAIARN